MRGKSDVGYTLPFHAGRFHAIASATDSLPIPGEDTMTLPPLLENPLQHLLSRLEAKPPRWIVGMAGVPGSGKSTLAARLAEQVNTAVGPGTMMALGMDGFHLTRAE